MIPASYRGKEHDTKALIERVRGGFPPGHAGRALAALSELEARLEAAQLRSTQFNNGRKFQKARAEAAEERMDTYRLMLREEKARVAALEEALREIVAAGHVGPNALSREANIARAALVASGKAK